MKKIKCFFNPRVKINNTKIRSLVDTNFIDRVSKFHHSIPNYSATPLVELSELSNQLNVAKILIKDESFRFELNAFKMLGASYAMACELAKTINLTNSDFTFQDIIARKSDYKHMEFVTATDGNHGRAVAWSAKLFGCQSHVFMPKGSSDIRLEAIKNYTKNAIITDMNYDDTVNYASQQAKDNGWLLIQDTAWQGYTQIPDNIMRGYFSLLKEFETQAGNDWPTHIFLQAGVGSMAASIASYLVIHEKPTPKIILVEPTQAPCFFESMRIGDGEPHRIGDLNTVMAGLACGEPSINAWQILSNVCSAFIVCEDEISLRGMQRYAHPLGNDCQIKSGESGAVTLGVVESLLSDSKYSEICANLELNSQSKILLLSTEGDTDPDFYNKVINCK